MNQWLDDLRIAIAFLTRLPMPHPDGARPESFARAQRLFPLVGAGIGAAVGLFCLLLRSIGVPDLAAAALTLGGAALLTGALHEDGLADVADGFGGGRDVAVGNPVADAHVHGRRHSIDGLGVFHAKRE